MWMAPSSSGQDKGPGKKDGEGQLCLVWPTFLLASSPILLLPLLIALLALESTSSGF